MKSILMRLTAAALLGLSATVAMAVPSFADPVKITVVGVGDIYAFEGGKVRGGFARLNAVARAEKAANPNTLYLFDGDMISPSLLSGLDQGSNTIELTNVFPFDLAVPATTNSISVPTSSLSASSSRNIHGLRSTSKARMATQSLASVTTRSSRKSPA